jgi:hypothetical protein
VRSSLFDAQSLLVIGIFFTLLAVKIFAFGDALARSAASYVSAGKLTKQAWLLILGLALGVDLITFNPISLLSLIGTVAAFVYLADARPALKEYRGTR